MPFSVVEGTGFRKLLKVVSPLYKIPARNSIKRRIIDKFDVMSNIFKEKLSKTDSLTLTTDIWTETMQMKSFLGITVHFLEGVRLISACLDTVELSESHTGEYICDVLNRTLDLWKINQDNITAVVSMTLRC